MRFVPVVNGDTSVSMTDPDPEIRGEEGGCRSSRPLGRSGGGRSPKKKFPSFGPQFGRKIRGARAPPGPATECDNMRYHTLESTSHQGHLDGEQVS